MNDYKQPDFFRFGHDSLELIHYVKEHASVPSSLLDLGAGSGILGIELANHFRPKKLTLVEVQTEYLTFLQDNLAQQLTTKLQSEIVLSSFGEWRPAERFDLIVSNPPYYIPGKGIPSPDERRDLARTFKLDNWKILFERIAEALSEKGQAFLVIKNDKLILHHLKDFLPANLRLVEVTMKDIVILKLSRLNVD